MSNELRIRLEYVYQHLTKLQAKMYAQNKAVMAAIGIYEDSDGDLQYRSDHEQAANTEEEEEENELMNRTDSDEIETPDEQKNQDEHHDHQVQIIMQDHEPEDDDEDIEIIS